MRLRESGTIGGRPGDWLSYPISWPCTENSKKHRVITDSEKSVKGRVLSC